MSLTPVTFDIERDMPMDDLGGGESRVPNTVYSGLTGTLNYVMRSRVTRYETGSGQSVGQAPVTRMQGVLKMEPVPSDASILVNDRVKVRGGDTWLVWGKRTYERTQQFDVEQVT